MAESTKRKDPNTPQISADQLKAALDAVLATTRATLAATPKPPKGDPESCAEQVRQRLSEWIARKHTPTMFELEQVRGAAHAASLEAATLSASRGEQMLEAVRSYLLREPRIGEQGAALLGRVDQWLTAFGSGTKSLARLRASAAELLARRPRAKRKPKPKRRAGR